MSHIKSAARRLGAPVLGILALALGVACADGTDPVGPFAAAREAAAIDAQAARLSSDVNADLARLRATVARLHDFDEIQQLGWNTRLEPCFQNATGGMGLHMINGGYMGDAAVVRPDQPEALLFEPQKNGAMRFVGVEFIVPYSIAPREGPAPELFGQSYRRNDVFQLWALHVWVGRHNPDGLFADWNPTVSCDFYQAPAAGPAVAARHH